MTTPSMFPDDRMPIPPAIPRWVRLNATLDAQGRVAHVEIEALSVTGELLANRGYWPLETGHGEPQPLRLLLRCGWELCYPSDPA